MGLCCFSNISPNDLDVDCHGSGDSFWNLFLAWMPYACGLWAAHLHRQGPGRWWMLLIPATLWAIFFPNAPYIVTDFVHLRERPPISLWYDLGMLATFAWTGCLLAIVSLNTMQALVQNYLGGSP